MKSFLTLDDLSPRGLTVLLRADLNVPMKDGAVTDTTRIDRLVPTLKELSAKGARVVILSHFGRPKGRDESQSLAPVGQALAAAYGAPVPFVADCVGDAPKAAIAAMKDGEVILLENVRFYAEEEKDDAAFAAKIAALGQVYVNDAFSCAHRAHATTHGIARLLPAYAGRLMEAELDALAAALEKPERPVMGVVGGAKVSTKLDLLQNLVGKFDMLLLGGGMAYTFLAAQGVNIGKSLCEHEMLDQARAIMKKAEEKGCKIILPVDGVATKEFKANAENRILPIAEITADEMFLDIGAGTVAQAAAALKQAKTLLWNGPLGVFELEPFDKGTVAVAQAVAAETATGRLKSVAGGGDTVAALAHAGVEEKFSYISTAGGAFLEWLEGKTLPGVQALYDRAKELRSAA